MAFWWRFLGTCILYVSQQLSNALKSTDQMPWRQKMSTLEKFQLDLLNEHNAKRRIHKAAPLKLDSNLNKAAANIAIKIAHGKITPDKLPSANIFSTCSVDKNAVNGKDVTDSWYNEICDSVFDSLHNEEHAKAFTRMLWQGSKRLGVGLYLEPYKKGKVCFAVAAVYSPQGNRRGYYPDNLNFDSFNPDYCCVVGFLGPGCKDINKVPASLFISQPTKKQDSMELGNKKSYLPFLYKLPLAPANANLGQDGQMIYKVPLGFFNSPYQLSSLVTPPMTSPYQRPTAMTTDRLESQFVEQNLQNLPHQFADLNGAFTQDSQATAQEVQIFNPPLDEAQPSPNSMQNYAQQITDVQPGNLENTASTLKDTYTTMGQDNTLLSRLTSAAQDAESLRAMQAVLSSGGIEKIGLPMTSPVRPLNGVQKSSKVKLRFEALKEHNKLRQLHDSPPMRLNDEMCAEADAYADLLANAGEIGYLKPRDGQNIFYECNQGNSVPSPKDAVQSWYGEVCGDGRLMAKRRIPNSNFRAEEGTQGAGHFTQMIWRNTSDFCLGMTTRRNKQGYFCTYFVARYRPPGNIASRFMENVHQGYFSPQMCSDGITSVNTILTQNDNVFPVTANLWTLPDTNDLQQGSEEASDPLILSHQTTQTQNVKQPQYSDSKGYNVIHANKNNNDKIKNGNNNEEIKNGNNNDNINNDNNNDNIKNGINNDNIINDNSNNKNTNNGNNNDNINNDNKSNQINNGNNNDKITNGNNNDHINNNNNNNKINNDKINNDHINNGNNNDQITNGNNNDRINNNNNNDKINNDHINNGNKKINNEHIDNDNITNNNSKYNNNNIIHEINPSDDKSLSKLNPVDLNNRQDQKMGVQVFASTPQVLSVEAGSKASTYAPPLGATHASRPDHGLAPTKTSSTIAKEVIENIEEEKSPHPTVVPSPPRLSNSTTLKSREEKVDNRSISHPAQNFEYTKKFQEEAVKLYNTYRRIHGSPTVKLDSDLATQAEEEVEAIIHNSKSSDAKDFIAWQDSSKNFFLDCNSEKVTSTAKRVVENWYRGVCDFSFVDPKYDQIDDQIGKFLSMIWKGTTKVGFSVRLAETKDGLLCTYVVAKHFPVRAQSNFATNVLIGSFNHKDMCSRDKIEDIASRTLGVEEDIPFRLERSQLNFDQDEKSSTANESEAVAPTDGDLNSLKETMSDVNDEWDNQDSLAERSTNVTEKGTAKETSAEKGNVHGLTSLEHIVKDDEPVGSALLDNFLQSGTKTLTKSGLLPDWVADKHSVLNITGSLRTVEDSRRLLKGTTSKDGGKKSKEIRLPQFQTLDEKWKKLVDRNRIRISKSRGLWRTAGLIAHNKLRKLHGAPPLQLDTEMANDADHYAKKLANDLLAIKDSGENIVLRHSNTSDGENLAMRCDDDLDLSPQEATQTWYSEECLRPYNYSKEGPQNHGHFTQVVWKNSKRLGIGFANFIGTASHCTVIVARYRPAGNFMLKFRDNVQPNNFKRSLCQTAIQLSEPTDDDFKLYASHQDAPMNKTVPLLLGQQSTRNNTSHALSRPQLKHNGESTKEQKTRNLAYHLKSMKSFKRKARKKKEKDFKPGDGNKIIVQVSDNTKKKQEKNLMQRTKRKGIGKSKEQDKLPSYAKEESPEETVVEHTPTMKEKNPRGEWNRLRAGSYDYTPTTSSFDATTMYTPTLRPDVSEAPSTVSTVDSDEDAGSQDIIHPPQKITAKFEDEGLRYIENKYSSPYKPDDENSTLYARQGDSMSRVEDEENDFHDNYAPKPSTTSSPRSTKFLTPTLRSKPNFSTPSPTMTQRPPIRPKFGYSNKEPRYGEESSAAGDVTPTNNYAMLYENESLSERKQTATSDVKRADNIGNSTSEDSIARQGLRIHNDLRAIHGSPPLILDKKLTVAATKEARKLLRRGSLSTSESSLADLIKREVIAHAPRLGKNLQAKCNTEEMKTSPADAVLSWYREVCKHPDAFDSGSYSGELNQFSQVIWAETTHLGFGQASLKMGKEVCSVIVAFYTPPGNTFASIKQNVPRGAFKPLFCNPGVLERKTNVEQRQFNSNANEVLPQASREEDDSARHSKLDVRATPTPGSTAMSSPMLPLREKVKIDGSDTSNARNTSPERSSLPSLHTSPSSTNFDHQSDDDKDFTLQALHEHNKLRQLHSAAPLLLDPALSNQAGKDASNIALMNVLSYADIKKIEMRGKNLYFSCSTDGEDVTGAKVTLNWYKELCNPGYDFEKRELRRGTEHFSRLIWKGSKRFGISKAMTEKDGVLCTYIVAVYSPTGNVRDQFLQNVRRGLFPEDGCSKFKSLLSQVLSSSSIYQEDNLNETGNPALSIHAEKVLSGIL